MLVNKKITVFILLFLTVIFLLPENALAQANFGANDLVDSGLGTANIKDVINNILNIAFGFLGILATLLIMYGGWLWMTSRGDSDQIDRAKKTITGAVIGLIIILSAYAIARFVISQIYGASNNNGNNNGNNGGGYHGGIGLGAGVIETHYPGRNASGIPRNTNIYITFKEPIQQTGNNGLVTSAAGDCDFALCASANFIVEDVTTGDIVPTRQIEATVSADGKTFGFNPYGSSANHLGRLDGETRYNIQLSSDLNKANGDPAFGLSGYDWNFTVSNEIDLTPPRITSVIPTPNSSNPRNVVVQINFSESINPLLAAGNTADGFVNIITSAPGNLAGSYMISNQYQTVEFITDELCGVNSCGGEVYCLPGNQTVSTLVTDAIEDMAANRLDGDNDGEVGGSYSWVFSTTNEIDLIPPEITSMQDNSAAPVDQPITVTFNKSLLGASISSENINFTKADGTDINYWLSLDNDRLFIHGSDLQTLSQYKPTLTSGIKDTRQNCWYPCACDDPSGRSCLCNEDTSASCVSGSHCETN